MRAPCRGFSLVELVMVMVLISILAAYASTRFDRDAFDAEARAGELLVALRYAQEGSMTNTGALNFEVVLNGNGFTVQRTGGGAVPDPMGGANYTAAWADAALAPAGNTVRFLSTGAPAWSGNITVTVGSSSKTVTVEASTGFVHQ